MVASPRDVFVPIGAPAVQFMVVLDIAIVNVALPSIQLISTSHRRTCSG